MLLEGKIRRFSGAVFGAHIAISALAVGAFIPTSAAAQTGEPLKIGYSMALSGGLGPNGRSALLAQKIWEEDTNAKGGLLGRPVKLIYYDDQIGRALGRLLSFRHAVGTAHNPLRFPIRP
jgi:branched-chain amino acid transport system substrate-binding protein